MLECPVLYPFEVHLQKLNLELLCAMAQRLDQIANALASQIGCTDDLRRQVEEVLERHRQAAEQYFATMPDPCGDEPFDRCPFLELPAGTKRRDLDLGAVVFLLPDGTILRVLGQSVHAALPNGAIEALVPDEDFRLHTSDGRTFPLDPDCPNCPQPPGSEPEEPELPEIPPDPAQCEEP